MHVSREFYGLDPSVSRMSAAAWVCALFIAAALFSNTVALRLVLLLGAALFGPASLVMPWALAALVVFSFFTVFQRVAYARARLHGPV